MTKLMKGYLDPGQVDYVLFHLAHSCKLSEEVRKHFIFRRDKEDDRKGKAIVFSLSKEAFSFDSVFREGGVPILFPASAEKGFFTQEGEQLVFHHDLLKSAFYLLSGIQELDPKEKDPLGRYPYRESLQLRLGVTGKPLVNYYFNILIDGISAYCAKNGLDFGVRRIFPDTGFFLTHDVDYLDTYTLSEAGYRVMQVLGLRPSAETWGRTFRIAWTYVWQSLNFIRRKNPHWDFRELREVEKQHGFRSAFFFLPKDQKHQDAYYRFQEPRVKKLIAGLKEEGCEIGIHGTIRSATSKEALEAGISELEAVYGEKIEGVRQHNLMFDRAQTHQIHEEAGLSYDTSLGFADREGFRNSYCLPYRPWDHTEARMMDYWEIPLTVMDVTLTHYRKYDHAEALKATRVLMDEVNKFGGVFVLLWHNGQNHDLVLPGITKLYHELLEQIADLGPECLIGTEIVKRMENEQGNL